jgi:hypothetical protein
MAVVSEAAVSGEEASAEAAGADRRRHDVAQIIPSLTTCSEQVARAARRFGLLHPENDRKIKGATLISSTAAHFLLKIGLTISLATTAVSAALPSSAQSSPPAQAPPAAGVKTTSHRLPPAPPIKSKPQSNQKTFASPQEAVSALVIAARNNDENGLLLILGPDAADIVRWTDNPDDRKAEREQFAQRYDQMHRLVKEPDGETTLYVGAENWPLPIPLVQDNGAWFFETSLGKQEILYRRIGENELNTIDVLHAIVDAQKEYYSQSGVGDGTHAYAARFNSGQNARDGLYWASVNNDSPIGPYLARASYNRSDRRPLHGYFFRILTEQGANARGGAKSYIVNGKMTAGFAVVAFPAQYRVSGVKTFFVNQDGTVYERDLGPMTTELAAALKAYNPDSTWRKTP